MLPKTGAPRWRGHQDSPQSFVCISLHLQPHVSYPFIHWLTEEGKGIFSKPWDSYCITELLRYAVIYKAWESLGAKFILLKLSPDRCLTSGLIFSLAKGWALSCLKDIH